MDALSFLLSSGGTALISSIVMQWLKKGHLVTFLGTEKEHEKMNLAFSLLMAFIVSLGIGYKFDEKAHILMITGLDPTAIWHQIGLAFVQWVQQHVAYKLAIVPTEMQGKQLEAQNRVAEQIAALVEALKKP